MLRKSLLLTAALCLLVAPMAVAAGNTANQTASAGENSQTYGVCMSGINGRGEAIPWASTESQCQYSTTGGSWVEHGIVKHNFNQNR